MAAAAGMCAKIAEAKLRVKGGWRIGSSESEDRRWKLENLVGRPPCSEKRACIGSGSRGRESSCVTG